MKKNNKISDIAKLFNVPIGTLYYWEKEGLFNIDRNADSRYREYSLADVLDIWEIILYRELGVPVREIKHILKEDLDSLEQVYKENEQKLQEEIHKLELRKKMVSRQRSFIDRVRDLSSREPFLSQPDLELCRKDNFDFLSMKASLQDPYNCCVFFEENPKADMVRCIVTEDSRKGDIAWIRKETAQYMQFLLKVNMRNPLDNNISQVRKGLKDRGASTGEIVARYLLVAGCDDSRYEYYRAWIQVK